MSRRETKSFDDEEQIDLEELTGATTQSKPANEQAVVQAVAQESSFASRGDTQKKPRKRSPYVIQKNMKMRIGMPELLAALTKKVKAGSDQETIEIALGALIEREGLEALKTRYEKLKTDS